jgi:hypothetical protein
MARYLLRLLWLAVLMGGAPPAAAQSTTVPVEAQRIAEAIRLAADDKAVATFLNAYVLQRKAGWGDGPLVGVFSTPFSRVVRAAIAARHLHAPFGPNDVTPDLIVEELHVVAMAQKGWPDPDTTAAVQTVVLAIHNDNGTETLIQPLRTTELSAPARALYGITTNDAGVVAAFPGTALTRSTVIRVTFDRTARGFGSSTCRECTVAVDLRRIR